MAVYLITWNLNRESNYQGASDAVHNALNKLDTTRDLGLETVRFVNTTSTMHQLYDYLAPYFDKNDRLVITKMVSGQYHGWLTEQTWSWINARA